MLHSMQISNINIGQLNAGRSTVATNEIRKLAEELKLDIVCIQEPYVRNGKIPGMPITAQQILAQNNAMSAIIIFNNKMRATTLTNLCGTHCIELQLHRTLNGVGALDTDKSVLSVR
jgi:endonuclease/exonuclease/phosphatase family metal-dependent hydrolase